MVISAIIRRRSTRRFKSTPVPRKLVEELLEAACMAPSAANFQPWQFYVVQTPHIKETLIDAANGQKSVAEAPVVIVVCAVPEQSAEQFGERGSRLYCLQDTAAAAENILIAATSLNLGTVWVGSFSEEKVSSVLKIPSNQRPVALIPVGYPDAEPKERNLKPASETCHWL